jgi:hypothetical protein
MCDRCAAAAAAGRRRRRRAPPRVHSVAVGAAAAPAAAAAGAILLAFSDVPMTVEMSGVQARRGRGNALLLFVLLVHHRKAADYCLTAAAPASSAAAALCNFTKLPGCYTHGMCAASNRGDWKRACYNGTVDPDWGTCTLSNCSRCPVVTGCDAASASALEQQPTAVPAPAPAPVPAGVSGTLNGRVYHAFSCDTASQNVTTSGAVSSGVKLKIVHSAACPLADEHADPLGPCFVSPQEVKEALSTVQPGMQAISLEGGSLYYLEHLTDRSPHEPVWYFLDNLPQGSTWKNHTASGPYFDTWASTVKRRVTTWFSKFKEIGGQVDYLILDFELGTQASYFHFKSQPTFGAAEPAVQQAMADARWPALQAELNAAGAPHGLNFSHSVMASMAGWGQRDLHGYVWNSVLLDRLIPRALNDSVYEPIRAHFPGTISVTSVC